MKTKVAFPVFHRIFFPLINALVYVHYISREKEKACERLDVTTVSLHEIQVEFMSADAFIVKIYQFNIIL